MGTHTTQKLQILKRRFKQEFS